MTSKNISESPSKQATGDGTEEGLPRDFDQVRRAAEEGDAEAQFYLGRMYLGGGGVESDNVKATSWFRKAADQGYYKAYTSLGYMLWLSHDFADAIKWFQLAVDKGDAEAQYYLGRMYEKGQGVPPNPQMAAMMFVQAGKQGFGPRANTDGVGLKLKLGFHLAGIALTFAVVWGILEIPSMYAEADLKSKMDARLDHLLAYRFGQSAALGEAIKPGPVRVVHEAVSCGVSVPSDYGVRYRYTSERTKVTCIYPDRVKLISASGEVFEFLLERSQLSAGFDLRPANASAGALFERLTKGTDHEVRNTNRRE